MTILSSEDEQRLRQLANGIAKDVEDIDKLLERLGFTREDYNELIETRSFKAILNQAQSEWEGAGNTHKRVKLKAAINIEQALPYFYNEMINPAEPLSSKVKAFEAVSRIAGLGNPELMPAGGGQFFKLEINLGDGKAPLIIDANPAIPPDAYSESSVNSEPPTLSAPRRELSKLFLGITNDNL